MTRFGRVLLLGAGAAFVAGGTVVSAQRIREPSGPDAFLNFQVGSTRELVAVLRTNARLRRLYASHFGVSEAEVIDYIQRVLVPYRLPRDQAVQTYGVTRDGRIYAVRTRLRRGTRVWANRSGVPVLKWLCANPLVRQLPGSKVPPPRIGRVRPPQVAVRPVRSLPEIAGPVVPPTMIAELETPPITPGGLEGGGVAVVPPVSPPGGSFPLGSLLPIAVALPLLFGGGGGGTPVQPTVIPEPNSLVLMCAAGGLPVVLSASARFRRRRRGGKARLSGNVDA